MTEPMNTDAQNAEERRVADELATILLSRRVESDIRDSPCTWRFMLAALEHRQRQRAEQRLGRDTERMNVASSDAQTTESILGS